MDLEGGIVHQHIELPEFLDSLPNRLVAEFLVRDISSDEKAASAFGFDLLLCDAGILMLVQIGDCHIRAFTRKEDGNGATDTGIAARDERDLFLKLARAPIKRSIVKRRRIEIGLRAGLALVLLWEGRSGIFPGPGLHGLLRLFLRPRLVGFGDLVLNIALATGGIYRCHRISP